MQRSIYFGCPTKESKGWIPSLTQVSFGITCRAVFISTGMTATKVNTWHFVALREDQQLGNKIRMRDVYQNAFCQTRIHKLGWSIAPTRMMPDISNGGKYLSTNPSNETSIWRPERNPLMSLLWFDSQKVHKGSGSFFLLLFLFDEHYWLGFSAIAPLHQALFSGL